jgi:uncharacterized membrane protein
LSRHKKTKLVGVQWMRYWRQQARNQSLSHTVLARSVLKLQALLASVVVWLRL